MGFNPPNGTQIQEVLTPCYGTGRSGNQPGVGYWASPGYWYDSTNEIFWLYYSPTVQPSSADPIPTPLALNQYQLGTTSPAVSRAPQRSTATLFCEYSPTPSVSSQPGQDGIVWAIEAQNHDNPKVPPPPDCNTNENSGHAALHAFDATTLQELYSDRPTKMLGAPVPFSTPTIFNGYVYVGTQTEVDVIRVVQPRPRRELWCSVAGGVSHEIRALRPIYNHDPTGLAISYWECAVGRSAGLGEFQPYLLPRSVCASTDPSIRRGERSNRYSYRDQSAQCEGSSAR
jgi:hypothetical protein